MSARPDRYCIQKVNMENVQKLLGSLQGCHSILGLCWPRPDVTQMAGSRIFIGTKPFAALDEGIRQTTAEFALLRELPNLQSSYQAWQLVTEIVARFHTLGRESQSSAIDPAYNLIYLATEVLYHHIANTFSVQPKHVQPFATVEPLEKLLLDCRWEQSYFGVESERILESLSEGLRAILEKLNNQS